MTKKPSREVRVLLHNIRSTYNVGSMFRTADSFGVSKIYLSGYTPTPVDKYGRARKDISKVSLGAEKSVAWEYEKHPKKIIQKIKKLGFKVVALEQDKNSIDYKKIKLDKNILLIVGNEVEGVDKTLLKLSDEIIEIPMSGVKESLNVSVAFGVAISRLKNI